MKVTQSNAYTKHGCNIRGDLVIVDYYCDMRNDPVFRRGGQSVCFEYIEKAKQLIRESFGEFDVKLSMPDLVVLLKGGEQ